jgi:hypothetical protein
VFFIVARKPRVEYKGAVYHVIHRGNNREYIFEDAADKRYLLSSIVDIKDPMGLSLMGYVIMSNHYHLLVKTGRCQWCQALNILTYCNHKFLPVKYSREVFFM